MTSYPGVTNDWTNPIATLENIKASILAAIKKEEDWYIKARIQHAIFSRTIRVLSLLLFAFGILWPMLRPEIKKSYPDIFDYGYLSLAIGGLFLLLDKYLGISSGYVRFYIAELDIKKNTLDFIENWNIETAKASNPISLESILALLNLVKTFRQAIFTTIQVETGAWATEFQTQTGELYELFKQKQAEYSKPANISVTVENFTEYTGIEIGIDQELPVSLNGATSIIFRNVSIQPHLIQIRAVKAGNTVSFSKNVEVTSDKTAEVVLSLP